MSKLNEIKNQKWFYEFALPDGTKTESYLPLDVKKIHSTRERILRSYIENNCKDLETAVDVSCHEGFFSLVLAEYFKKVTGIDKNTDSLAKATQISSLFEDFEINFVNSTVENWNETADLVLCFGLIYHVENPIQVLRKLAFLTEKSLCLETQVLPFNFTGSIEDGSFLWQRELKGTFGLCVDYSSSAEGGLTDLSLIPSKPTLEFLLRQFGFKTINFYQPESDDYEQFVRNHRIIVFAEK